MASSRYATGLGKTVLMLYPLLKYLVSLGKLCALWSDPWAGDQEYILHFAAALALSTH